jgi:hypothetical protein
MALQASIQPGGFQREIHIFDLGCGLLIFVIYFTLLTGTISLRSIMAAILSFEDANASHTELSMTW